MAYFTFYPTLLNPSFIDSITYITDLKYSDALISIQAAFNPDDYIEGAASDYSVMQADLTDLKLHISNSLLQDKKLILISESQGNLFVNKAVEELKATSLRMGDITKDIRDYESGNLQIATPVYSNITKNKVVLNDDDIIRIVFFDRPSSTFKDFSDPEIGRRHWLDKHLDHFVDGTYLNAYGSSEPLPSLKEFTLQSLIDTASLLESNCPVAVLNFDYSAENLTVNFDSTDPENPGINDLIYEWDFGDGNTEITYNKLIKHTYLAPGKYHVTLRVTNSEGRDFGEPAATQKEVTLTDTTIGCDGSEGQLRINYDGTLGGFIAKTAHVDGSVIISENIEVCGESEIYGSTIIRSGMIKDFRIENSTIRDSSLEMDSYVIYGSGWISNSIIENTTATYAKSFYIENSSIKNSNFGGDLVSVASTIENTSGLRAYIDNSTFRNVSTVHDIWTMNSAVTDSYLNFNGSSLSGDIRNSTITNSTIQIGGRVFRIHSSNVLNSSIVFTKNYYTNDGRGIYYSTLDGFNLVVDEFYVYQNIMTIYYPSGEKYVGPVSEFPY